MTVHGGLVQAIILCMSITRRAPMTVDEFLAWERRQELRYEVDGCEPVAMTGGTLNHSTRVPVAATDMPSLER